MFFSSNQNVVTAAFENWRLPKEIEQSISRRRDATLGPVLMMIMMVTTNYKVFQNE
jgi:hypothetical protein